MMKMYQCFARIRGSEDEFKPVMFGGLPFIAPHGALYAYVQQMELVYTSLEYEMREEKGLDS